MKKIAVLICLILMFCSACGGKEQKAQEQTEVANKIEQVASDINKKIANDPMSVEKADIDKAKESALEMEKELKAQVGKIKEDDVTQFQNRQVSVELLKQGLDALEKAKAEGDEEAVMRARTQIEMAQSLWDFEQEE